MVAKSVATEELLGPLNEVERKHAPRELFVEGDTSLATKGARVAIVGLKKGERSWPETSSEACRFVG
jgi:hypothetical protein